MTDPISARLRSASQRNGIGIVASLKLQSAADHIDAQDAKMKALVEALKPFSDKIIPDTLDPYGLPRPTVSGKCGDDAYRKAYDTLHALQMKGDSDA